MKVYATFRQEAVINPKEVIKNLINKEIGDTNHNWIVEKDDKFYHIHEQSAGCHSFDVENEISKDKYEYIRALELVLKHLS